VLIPGDNSCIYHALDYDGANIGANAFRQSTADFFSEQPEYAIEKHAARRPGKVGLE
jgi:hypothetical protein